MQRIYPARTRDGFTLVETLIALLITTILLGASATALMKILRVETTTARMQQSTLAIQTIGCRKALQQGDTNEFEKIELHAARTQKHIIKANDSEWEIWEINYTSFPPFSTSVAYPVAKGDPL